MNLSFFTTLQVGWFNAWIPLFGMVLIQFVYMAIYREGGKRAVDTSWYTTKDKCNATVSTLSQIILLLLSIFVPLKYNSVWFVVGLILFVPSLGAFVSAFHSYAKAPMGETIKRGVYRWSRNPMYFFFMLGSLAVCIASASLWLLLLLIPFAVATHFTILGEERYCAQTYGDDYLVYKASTPRYFLC